MPELSYLEVNPKGKHTASVIWLHGLGADGSDFESLIPELKLPDDHEIHFIFPNAPLRSITINGGAFMPAWYDIFSMDFGREIDVEQIDISANQIEELIEMEMDKGIEPSKIVIAGFSQGGAVALHTALRFPEPLAGIMALSTYLGDSSYMEEEDTVAPNKNIPIFMAHGMQDPVVPYDLGRQSVEVLEDASYKVQWMQYEMEHSLCQEEIVDLRKWLLDVLS